MKKGGGLSMAFKVMKIIRKVWIFTNITIKVKIKMLNRGGVRQDRAGKGVELRLDLYKSNHKELILVGLICKYKNLNLPYINLLISFYTFCEIIIENTCSYLSLF